MLHGVMAKNEKVSWEPLRPQLSPSELQRVLQILARYYQFITVDQCIDMLNGKIPLIDNALLISFDDGYRNTVDYALPICEKFCIKPIVFIATGQVDSGLPFWFDRLDYALQQNMGELISLEYKGIKYSFDATSRQSLKLGYQNFRDDCKHAFADDMAMNELFNALSEMLELRSGKALRDICANDDWSSIVSWGQLREAVKENRLDVGSHSVDHWRINCLPEELVLSQLTESKRHIEEELSYKCHYFCYPNVDYNQLAARLVKESGYLAGFSTGGGRCKVKDDLMTLKRLDFPRNKTKAEIIYQLNW